jgi:hypothetical protein
MNQHASGWAIDPATQTITAAAHTWESCKAWIGCDLLERVHLPGSELWVNEEGFLLEDHRPWILNGGQMIAGRAFLCGREWTRHTGRHLPTIGWLPATARVESPVARAYPMTPEGLAQMARDAQEERGMAELAAVGAEVADWPNDGRRPVFRQPTLGDFVTVASGLTGCVVALENGWVAVRFVDGREVQVPANAVDVVEVDE